MSFTMLIAESALLRRINRRLTPRFERLSKLREHEKHHHHGHDYVHLDTYRNTVLGSTNDLEAFAKEVGAVDRNEIVECY